MISLLILLGNYIEYIRYHYTLHQKMRRRPTRSIYPLKYPFFVGQVQQQGISGGFRHMPCWSYWSEARKED